MAKRVEMEYPSQIKLGYELKTGKPVFIKPSHLIATGVTQLSGKTTTLEALINRSPNKKAIVFKTKIGETGFTEGTIIPPYYKERSDWQYVSQLLEATLKEKLKFERAWIIKVCKNADSLIEVRHNIAEQLANSKVRGLSRNVYETLAAYLDLVLPQLQYAAFSKTLTLHDGINIMDLERFRDEIQSLVIRSVLDKVLNEMKGIIVVMPEAWKYLPQGRGNPCKLAAEAFIRQGATNENYLWIDSQDMAGVDKTPLKQVSTWILGLQTERNEVKHTLDQIALPRKKKPKEDEIMTLSLGHFILTSPDQTVKVYVQPAWLANATAIQVAKGEVDVGKIKAPIAAPLADVLKGLPQPVAVPTLDDAKAYARISRDLVQMRTDFFNKIKTVRDDLDSRINALGKGLTQLDVQIRKAVNVDEIVSLVLQKMPMTEVDEGSIVEDVLRRIPKVTGAVTYEVAPLKKLQKDFLEEAKTTILNEASQLDAEQKKMLKFLESIQRGSSLSEIMEKGLFMSATSGGSRQRVSKKLRTMATATFVDYKSNRYHPHLKQKIANLLEIHTATPDDIEQVYNHIIMEICKE